MEYQVACQARGAASLEEVDRCNTAIAAEPMLGSLYNGDTASAAWGALVRLFVDYQYRFARHSYGGGGRPAIRFPGVPSPAVRSDCKECGGQSTDPACVGCLSISWFFGSYPGPDSSRATVLTGLKDLFRHPLPAPVTKRMQRTHEVAVKEKTRPRGQLALSVLSVRGKPVQVTTQIGHVTQNPEELVAYINRTPWLDVAPDSPHMYPVWTSLLHFMHTHVWSLTSPFYGTAEKKHLETPPLDGGKACPFKSTTADCYHCRVAAVHVSIAETLLTKADMELKRCDIKRLALEHAHRVDLSLYDDISQHREDLLMKPVTEAGASVAVSAAAPVVVVAAPSKKVKTASASAAAAVQSIAPAPAAASSSSIPAVVKPTSVIISGLTSATRPLRVSSETASDILGTLMGRPKRKTLPDEPTVAAPPVMDPQAVLNALAAYMTKERIRDPMELKADMFDMSKQDFVAARDYLREQTTKDFVKGAKFVHPDYYKSRFRPTDFHALVQHDNDIRSVEGRLDECSKQQKGVEQLQHYSRCQTALVLNRHQHVWMKQWDEMDHYRKRSEWTGMIKDKFPRLKNNMSNFMSLAEVLVKHPRLMFVDVGAASWRWIRTRLVGAKEGKGLLHHIDVLQQTNPAIYTTSWGVVD